MILKESCSHAAMIYQADSLEKKIINAVQFVWSIECPRVHY